MVMVAAATIEIISTVALPTMGIRPMAAVVSCLDNRDNWSPTVVIITIVATATVVIMTTVDHLQLL